tara:strand:- start:24 stop:1316 length:1293 start_codon:yes stop_codon:yes gene_type:complete
MARITSKQAKEMNEAYAKVHQNLSEKYVSKLKQRQLDKQAAEAETNRQAAEIEKENPGALRKSFSGALLNKNTSNNNTSNNTQVKTQNTQTTEKPVAQNNTQPTNNNTSSSGGLTTAQRPATGGQPQGGTPVNKLFGRGGSDGSPAPYTGGPNAAQRANAGTVQRPTVQAQPAQQQKPGVLGRLGSLAGRAANAARNAAGGIKQVATSAASNIKKGAQAVAGGVKRVAGGVADAATGNLTDFDKRGGKPQGVARVVAGGIDKLTGDRTDLDKRGPSKPAQQPSGGQQPAQQQAQPAQQSAKLSNNSPAAKAGIPLNMRQAAADRNAKFQAARKSGNLAQYRKDNPQLSGAERAKAMARERIAAKKAAPAKPVQKKVTSVMDMEGYDPMENLFDDTVQFLVSEGHAKDKSEAISIMSESEFIDAFNQELNE